MFSKFSRFHVQANFSMGKALEFAQQTHGTLLATFSQSEKGRVECLRHDSGSDLLPNSFKRPGRHSLFGTQ
jgi:hypothetical protein